MNHINCRDNRDLMSPCMPSSDTDSGIYTGLTALPENPTVTMAYIPFQTCRQTYDEETAFSNGTLFPVLNKPFLGACR